jgi:choline-glycine betaine transporter
MSGALALFWLDLPFGELMNLIVGFLIVTTYAEHVVADTFLLKRIPGDIRASTKGIVNAFALLMTFGFHIASHKLVSSGYSATVPLIIIAALDALIVAMTFVISIAEIFPDMTRSDLRGIKIAPIAPMVQKPERPPSVRTDSDQVKPL